MTRALPAVLLACALGLSGARPAAAQSSPFLPEPLFRALVNEISGDRAYENVRHLTHYHRTGGSPDFFAAAEWIRQAAEAAGLEDVRLVRQAYDRHGWSCTRGEAWLVEPEERKLADCREVAISIADMSRSASVTAELVDVGQGTRAADYEGRDVKGKIVLASGSPSAVHVEAVWKRGAAGVVSYATSRQDLVDYPDQVAWGRVPFEAKGVEGVAEGTPPTFAVMLSPRRGRSLQRELAAAQEPYKLRVELETAIADEQEQAMVEGWIRGSEIHDQQIVLTAHIQEEMTSANDDGSGCGNLLEIGRALARLVREGKLARPRRDIRFWWVNEFSSEQQLFRDNPQEPRRMLLNVNQDMVGARQSWGGRVQYASRLPWSLPHALDDVMESVLQLVRDGNTELLTMRGTGQRVPFLKEIVATKGSREPYHARMVPYFDSTDHHAFTPARIGVPGTSLTNWPDDWIHSTGDDLDNIDATQLERNAVVVAGVAVYFAGLGDTDAASLAAYVATRARQRIAADRATAVAHLAQAAPAERAQAWRAARNLVRQSFDKERRALASIRRLAAAGRAGELVAWESRQLESEEGRALESLERAWTAVSGSGLPPNIELGPDERALAGKVYVPVSDLAAFEKALDKLEAKTGLHSMMRFEVLNFADGQRDGHEVYEAVAAEALSAGEWYYGRVSPADVKSLLDAAVAAGAYTVRAAR